MIRIFLADDHELVRRGIRKTVKNYVSRLLEKLGLQRRTQAAVYRTRQPS